MQNPALLCLQKENADKEKEKEKQERIEASLREREREVRASQAELAKAREKEKEQHLRDKAEQHFYALLADMVRKITASRVDGLMCLLLCIYNTMFFHVLGRNGILVLLETMNILCCL